MQVIFRVLTFCFEWVFVLFSLLVVFSLSLSLSLSLYSSLRAIAIAFVDANVVNVVVLSRIFMLFLHLCSSDDLNDRRSLRIVSVCVFVFV